jgi:putative Mg2+ transporter-C (MgtC) family protein
MDQRLESEYTTAEGIMPIAIEWPEIAWRLILTVLAGTLLGINRTERGMAAGLRTTLLVSLAAAVSMIQVNLLLHLAGRAPDSFISLDLMRLPLGILTGMGFIGAGAILRREDIVSGVTTAAALWLTTVLGLCFGGGQNGLGLAALAFGIFILWALKRFEQWIPQERRAVLTLTVAGNGPSEAEIYAGMETAGYRVASWNAAYLSGDTSPRMKIRCELHWQGQIKEVRTPEFIRKLGERQGVESTEWEAAM